MLDVGCGNGRISRLVAPRVAHVTGIDLSGPRAGECDVRAEPDLRAGRRSGVPPPPPPAGVRRGGQPVRDRVLTPGPRGRSG
ncbi:methyltransferase domain-containing protein [Saccharothrix texasensis]|uniref:methyltransferase domain-containing protein n=1 Tax=Saccharothrix texasensis TaxID=103734 RepID=UPI0014771D12|nr:class I SAM-dependent methyltransferase [Saccharothrix texasensis]